MNLLEALGFRWARRCGSYTSLPPVAGATELSRVFQESIQCLEE